MSGDLSTAGIGHNNPPLPTPVELARYLGETESDLLKRRDELLAGVARFEKAFPVISDDEEQGKASDFHKMIGQAIKKARDRFMPAKKPWLDGGRQVDAFFKSITDPLEAAQKAVARPMEAYALQQREIARKAREEAARIARDEADRKQRQYLEDQRQQAEAEAAARPPAPTIEETIAAADAADRADKAANVKSADLTRTRGDLGGVSSLRDVWEVEVEDITKVPAEYLLFNQALARKAVSGGKLQEIPGCRVFVKSHIQTR